MLANLLQKPLELESRMLRKRTLQFLQKKASSLLNVDVKFFCFIVELFWNRYFDGVFFVFSLFAQREKLLFARTILYNHIPHLNFTPSSTSMERTER